jgi:hypothetical protein
LDSVISTQLNKMQDDEKGNLDAEERRARCLLVDDQISLLSMSYLFVVERSAGFLTSWVLS